MVHIEVLDLPNTVDASAIPSIGTQQLYSIIYSLLFVLIPLAIVLVLLPIPVNYVRAYLGPRGDMNRTCKIKKRI
jgi:hypothetical protein